MHPPHRGNRTQARADTRTRDPLSRLSSPTKRPGPCLTTTWSAPSEVTTISTSPVKCFALEHPDAVYAQVERPGTVRVGDPVELVAS